MSIRSSLIKIQAAASNAKHTLQVGSILFRQLVHESAGADTEYYQVTRVLEKSVEIRKIDQKWRKHAMPLPLPNKFVGSPMVKRVIQTYHTPNVVKMSPRESDLSPLDKITAAVRPELAINKVTRSLLGISSKKKAVQKKQITPARPVPTQHEKDVFRRTAEEFHTRHTNVQKSLTEVIQKLGRVTLQEAEKVAQYYIKERYVKIDSVGGGYRMKHGAFLDRDVIKRAVDLIKA